jgi:hypothetical protein
MATVINWKDVIDKPMWRTLSGYFPTFSAASQLVFDMRAHAAYRYNPVNLVNAVAAGSPVYQYHPAFDCFNPAYPQSALSGGTAVAGFFAIYAPSNGPSGVVGGTPTVSSFQLAALPNSAVVETNALADKDGGGGGWVIRVVDPITGLTEERRIIANTYGATPIVYLDKPLSYAPTAAQTKYELLSGRIYILGTGTTAAGFFRAIDVSTWKVSGNLNVTNLAATIGTETCGIMLDEQYVPYTRNPGEGMIVGASQYDTAGDFSKYCLLATASGATSITGQAAAGDAAVLQNEYRNFQVRIVEDTAAPTAVGQRRRIVSHTAGPSAAYTVAAWTVTPSANAKFVIELNNDLILQTNGAVVMYAYAAGGFAADANWSTGATLGGAGQYTDAAAGSALGEMLFGSWFLEPDVGKNVRHSMIVKFRANASLVFEELDIAGGAKGTWRVLQTIPTMYYSNITTGTTGVQDPANNGGELVYINWNATQDFVVFNMKTRTFFPYARLRIAQSTARQGQRMAWTMYDDGGNDRDRVKVSVVYCFRSNGTELYDTIIMRNT